MKLECPYCSESIPYRPDLAGQNIDCSWCQKSIKMPTVEELSAEDREQFDREQKKAAAKQLKQEAIAQRRHEKEKARAQREQEREQARREQKVDALVQLQSRSTRPQTEVPQGNMTSSSDCSRTKQLLVLKGRSGKTIVVQGGSVRVVKVGSLFAARREKTILIRNVTSVEVKKPGTGVVASVGFIQFSIAGGAARDSSFTFTGGALSAVADENSVVFADIDAYNTALQIKQYIENYREDSEQTTEPELSAGDGIPELNDLSLAESIKTPEGAIASGCVVVFGFALLCCGGVFSGCPSSEPSSGWEDNDYTTEYPTDGNYSQEWYEGGTLHNATMREWMEATHANKLATSADFVVTMLQKDGDTVPPIDELRPLAGRLAVAISQSNASGQADSQSVSAVAATCWILMSR